MNKYIYKLSLVLILFFICNLSKAEKVWINLLDEQYFGFEAGNENWWFWNENYWGTTMERASSGQYCMRFSADMSDISSVKKAQCGSSGSLTLAAGTYNMSMMVWVEPGNTLELVRFVVKSTWEIFDWQLDTVTPGQWVNLSREITLVNDVENSDWQLQILGSESGAGTIFLDELSILQEVELSDIPGEVSIIQSVDSVGIKLDSGSYTMRLHVFKDAVDNRSCFYTRIGEHKSLVWDIGAVDTGAWVELEQVFSVLKQSDSTNIAVIFPNNPDYGSPAGAVFIDSLVIEPSILPDNNHAPIALTGNDASIRETSSITLNAIASYDIDGDSLLFSWIVNGGGAVDNPVSATPVFTAPLVDSDMEVELILTLSDGHLQNRDTITITVLNNHLPTPHISSADSAVAGTTIVLSGGMSYDEEDDALHFNWQSDDVDLITGINEQETSFIAPHVKDYTNIAIALVVHDGLDESDPVSKTITIIPHTTSDISNESITTEVYPSVSSDLIHIVLAEESLLEIYNLSGLKLLEELGFRGVNQMNLESLPAAVYILRVVRGKESDIFRIEVL